MSDLIRVVHSASCPNSESNGLVCSGAGICNSFGICRCRAGFIGIACEIGKVVDSERRANDIESDLFLLVKNWWLQE